MTDNLILPTTTSRPTTNPLAVVNFALSYAPDELTFINFSSLVRKSTLKRITLPPMDGFRGGTHQVGRLLVDVPAIVAKTLKLPPADRDFLLLIHIPHEIAARSESGIILTP